MAVHEWIVFYSQKKYDRWCAGHRHGYVTDEPHRYMYCEKGRPQVTTAKRKQYFGEATMTTFLRFKGFYVWHERYQLDKFLDGNGIFARNNRNELEPFMSLPVKRALIEAIETEHRQSGFAFKNPDLVAFDLDDDRWGFFEIKMPNDGLREWQEESLELLQRLVPNSTSAVIYMRPAENEKLDIPFAAESA